MQTPRRRGRVAKAWSETKLAVRAYSKDPTKANETQVRLACSQLRDESAVMPRATPGERAKSTNRTHG